MKQLFFTISLLIFLNYFAQAQVEKPITKGHFLAGGAVGFNYQNTSSGGSSGKTTSFNFTPKVGYFVANQLAIGLGLNLLTSHSNINESSTNAFSLNPFIRYYDQSGLFGHADIGFGSATSRAKINLNNNITEVYFQKDRIFNFSLGLGYAWFLNNRVALEGLLAYQYQANTNRDNSNSKTNYNRVNFNLGFQIFF